VLQLPCYLSRLSKLSALLPSQSEQDFCNPQFSPPKEKVTTPGVSQVEEKKSVFGKRNQPLHKKPAVVHKGTHRGSVKMVVGDDIPLYDVPQLVGKTLVGISQVKSLGENPSQVG
jgi:hypothetical protein